jgi:hypothetical protein
MARPARGAAAPAEPPAPAPAPALSVPTPVPSPEAAAPEPSVPEQFDAAFSEAVAAEATSPPAPSVTPTPVAAAAPKKPAEPKKDSTPAVEPPASVPAEPPQPESPTGEPLPPQPPERSPQPQPQNPPPQPPPPPPPPPQPQPQPQVRAQQEPPLFDADEVAQLQTFYTDWPDVARATETMIRGIMGQTARRMYQDMAASLAPYLQTIDTLADRQQLSELQGNVPDYNTVAGQLTSWAASQPTYLRSAYEHVIKSGTAAEVVDLINRYKQDMQLSTPAQGNQPAPAAPAASAPASTPAPAPVSPALAAAAARLAPVSTKRTNVVAPPADFDTAFAEFARAS